MNMTYYCLHLCVLHFDILHEYAWLFALLDIVSQTSVPGFWWHECLSCTKAIGQPWSPQLASTLPVRIFGKSCDLDWIVPISHRVSGSAACCLQQQLCNIDYIDKIMWATHVPFWQNYRETSGYYSVLGTWLQQNRLIQRNHCMKTVVEMPGFEPGASYMRSKRSTAELHPQGVI